MEGKDIKKTFKKKKEQNQTSATHAKWKKAWCNGRLQVTTYG